MHSEVKRLWPLVQRMTAPMDETQVYALMQPLIIIYGPPRFADTAEGKAASNYWLSTYTRALRGIQAEALEHAVSEYIRSGPPKYRQKAWNFPEPSDLVTLAKPAADKLSALVWRVRKAAEAPNFVDRDSDEFRAEQAALKEQWAREGLLRPDGTFDAAKFLAAKRMPGAGGPQESQAAAAARIRQQAGIS